MSICNHANLLRLNHGSPIDAATADGAGDPGLSDVDGITQFPQVGCCTGTAWQDSCISCNIHTGSSAVPSPIVLLLNRPCTTVKIV